ncbi:MAG: Catalase related subgroup protein [Verrucomicrobiaceae bacterium]|nr:Catalase related subgroup protein [Verrucomicrobiaceae bacterium]
MKTSFNSIQKIIACAALLAGPAGAHDQDSGVEVKPIREEKLANAPGQALSAATVTYAPGAKSTAHHHAGSVLAYVLSGAIRSENSATGPARVYHAGESFFEPAGSQHLVSENASTTEPASLLAVFVAGEGATLTTVDTAPPAKPAGDDLAHQILQTMIQVHGHQPGHRPVHAKGIICEGTFAPSKEAAALSMAPHLQKMTVPVIVRFSEGSPDPAIPDNSPDAGPRGMAIQFKLPDGGRTDIVAMSHHGFVVATGEEFLALQRAVVATDPAKPHPWPVEQFVGSHPLALKFVQDNQKVPASFATEAFFSNDSFVFVNTQGHKQAGRYQLLPVAGLHGLSATETKAKPPGFLIEDLKKRLAVRPVKFRLVVQLPNSGDTTNDPSLVWPDDRRTVELGTISLATLVPHNAIAEQSLAFDPAELTEGIELSDDPLPALRSKVYALSVKYRHETEPSNVPSPTAARR